MIQTAEKAKESFGVAVLLSCGCLVVGTYLFGGGDFALRLAQGSGASGKKFVIED